jgi:hypothetical protein
MYFDVRDRVVGTIAMMNEADLARPVPACPEWSSHALFAHLVSMPMAILAGDIPDEVTGGGDPNPWLGQLVEDNVDRPVIDLARWWASDDAALATVVANAGLLLADLVTHEGDIHGAIGSRAHRNVAELDSQIDASLAGMAPYVEKWGLAPIAVDNGRELRTSGQGEPGWTLHTNFWEAHRVLNSRRTREELLAIDHGGNPADYFDALDAHLPLPQVSLGEA